jgi:replication factor C subunit 3/5
MDVIDDKFSKDIQISKSSLPWVEKYRPNSLDELIAHEEIISILNKLIESHKLPHLLFHGPPGTGESFLRYNILKRVYYFIHSSQVKHLQ